MPRVSGVTRTAIDFDDQQPLYVQLAEILRGRIASGEIPPRRALPSKRQLMQEYEVSARTVDSAMALLRDEGLIVTERGKGLFVTERGDT